VLTRRGHRALRVIREAVGDAEREWAQKLGAKRFAQLRVLLLELNELPSRPPACANRRSRHQPDS
jgi:hypothetical protein